MINPAAMLGLGNRQATKDLKTINVKLGELIKLKYAETADAKKYRKEQKEQEKRDRQDYREMNQYSENEYRNFFEKFSSKDEEQSEKNWLASILGGAAILGGLTMIGGVKDFIDGLVQEVQQMLGVDTTSDTPGASAPAGGGGVSPVEANLSSKEQNLFQRLVLAEAKSEGKTGMALVARSVMNRAGLIQKGIVSAGTFNAKDGSITSVIKASNQYQPVSDGSINRDYSKDQLKLAAEAIALAQDVSKLRSILKNEGKGRNDIKNLVAATGFRTGYAFNDPSQNVNVTKYKNHYFNTAGNKNRSVQTPNMDSPMVETAGGVEQVEGTIDPSKISLPPLPPTDTLGGGVQRYGASRSGGTRKHAGVDFDAPDDGKFYSRIGGKVIFAGNVGGGYGNVVDIYNPKLNATERIAEGSKIHVKAGDNVSAGKLVQSGTHKTGVFHYEIRPGKAGQSGSFEGTVNPIQFLNKESTKKGIIVYQKKQAGGVVDMIGHQEVYSGTKVAPKDLQINSTKPDDKIKNLTTGYMSGGMVTPSSQSNWENHKNISYNTEFFDRKSQVSPTVIVIGGGSSPSSPSLPSAPAGGARHVGEDNYTNYYDYAKMYSTYCRGIKV